MAKRTKGYASAEDDPRDDDVDTPDTDTKRDYSAQAEGYEVLDPGTIIDGIYYPKPDVPAGEEMMVHLSDAQAQALVDSGVRLSKDGEECVATPIPETQPAEALEPAPKDETK